MKIIIYAFKIWLTILPIAFINGTIRVALINPYFGEKLGHIISTLMLSVVIVFIVYLFKKKIKYDYTKKELLIIGLTLMTLTMIFEFGLGLATGKSWKFMLADYNIFQGRIWLLVLITELLSPLILKKINK